jgi:hypothetical protein
MVALAADETEQSCQAATAFSLGHKKQPRGRGLADYPFRTNAGARERRS